jgi:cytochrome b6-f complex iron-sulfur subunit
MEPAPTSADRSSNMAPAAAAPDRGRRRFMQGLLGFSIVSMVAMVVAPIVGFLIPPKTEASGAGEKTPAGSLNDLPVGTGEVVAMGSSPVIVVRTDDSSANSGVKAFSAVCTHLGCIVEYDSTSNQIHCPCHDGRFNPANGAVVSGPPPQALPPVNVALEGDQIFLVAG